jgi:putative transposase
MLYKRVLLSGQSYFFTVNLADRQSNLLVENIQHLRQVFGEIKRNHPFIIEAMVVLPEHLHCIWTLPQGDYDDAKRWALIKARFSFTTPRSELISRARQSKRERSLWQRRFWQHRIDNNCDMEHHINYIHSNPVKHGYVLKASDWPYSSIHKYIRKGILPAN